jgi:hypothetical protein
VPMDVIRGGQLRVSVGARRRGRVALINDETTDRRGSVLVSEGGQFLLSLDTRHCEADTGELARARHLPPAVRRRLDRKAERRGARASSASIDSLRSLKNTLSERATINGPTQFKGSYTISAMLTRRGPANRRIQRGSQTAINSQPTSDNVARDRSQVVDSKSRDVRVVEGARLEIDSVHAQ